jgi:hypothetical protein
MKTGVVKYEKKVRFWAFGGAVVIGIRSTPSALLSPFEMTFLTSSPKNCHMISV